MTLAKLIPSPRLSWCVLVGGWSLVFAAPHFYWALGGRAGLGAQAAAADAALQQSWFAVYNVAAGCMGILGAVVAYALGTSRGSRCVRRWLRFAAAIGGGVLLLRGMLGMALLVVSMLDGTPDQQLPLVLVAIEPWFVVGGLAFGGMSVSHREQRAGVAARSR